MIESPDFLLVNNLLGFVLSLLSAVALLAAGGAVFFCAVQMKKVPAELRERAEALRRLAGEPPEEEEAAE